MGLNDAANSIALRLGAVKLLAWFCATATSTVPNFLGMKFVVFRKKARRVND